MKVAVIGAGPSGLATLKYLKSAHRHLGCEAVEVRLFDRAPKVGGTFAARAYENAELVSSRQLTTFSDFRWPARPDFLSAEDYVQYLNEFCSNFNLCPDIWLNTEVVRITRRSSGHNVKYSSPLGQEEWDCDAIAICSGLHVNPHVPNISGLEHVNRVINSSEFRSSKQFEGSRTVMLVGAGETGADISYIASNTPGVERVVLCHKDGVHFAPKVSINTKMERLLLKSSA
ncbi:hypothetical protein Golomagni_07211 [Golovinomyces magnicellulatus]|nr:hypothetical protein Golomagni_07211 [Golovinomyces magnicellulatus]